MAGLIYSANFGGYDTPKPLTNREDGIDYTLFSDKTTPTGWDLEWMKLGVNSPLFMARQIKVMVPHMLPHYDWFLWLDGTMKIKAPLLSLIGKLLESPHDFAAFQHNEWQCAYTEIEKCLERKKDTAVALAAAETSLRREKLPRNFGHAATGVLFRKGTALVRSHALAWWLDMQATTLRDQCTFMLNLWNQRSYVEWIPGLHTKNRWIDYRRGHVG